jgi:hypothetical protein
MPKVLVITTTQSELPQNCLECFNSGCYLPLKGKNMDMVKTAYLTKRHSQCPLAFANTEDLEPVSRSRKSRV